MPSVSLTNWRAARLPSLREIEMQCATTLATASANPHLAEENVRGYIVLLSAHFQGFCRDLYTECAQVVTSKVRPSLHLLVQTQFTTNYALDRGNPNMENLRRDFNRFLFELDLAADPPNVSRIKDLAELNRWRNIVAHHGVVPKAGLPGMASIRGWQNSCDGLATSLDQIMYNQLRSLLRRQPWPP
jgi:hypothetical protein